MKTRAAFALIAVAFLALAGCSNGEPQQLDMTDPYIGGLGALAFSFAEGMPPEYILDAGKSVFAIGVNIENLGESAVGPGTLNDYGYVEVVGINNRHFNKFQDDLRVYFSEADLVLNGARRNPSDQSILNGDFTVLTFSDLSYTPDTYGNQPFTIRANACYEYRTYNDARICIKDNVLEQPQDDSICVLNGAKPIYSSGGPVKVTNLKQNPIAGNKIQVVFTVENLGDGVVFAPWEYQVSNGLGYGDDACAMSGTNMNRDVVYIEVGNRENQAGEYLIECPQLGGNNEGTIPMYRGSPATVSCTLTTYDGGSRIYTEALHIDVSYTYFQYIEKPLLIRDASAGFVEPGTIR